MNEPTPEDLNQQLESANQEISLMKEALTGTENTWFYNELKRTHGIIEKLFRERRTISILEKKEQDNLWIAFKKENDITP